MNLAIIGAQWGDEGKGKIVDLIAPHFDIVTRYQGGHNAGHTVIIRRNGDLIEVDSRPSDAIALGVGSDTPIYVEEHVLREAEGEKA